MQRRTGLMEGGPEDKDMESMQGGTHDNQRVWRRLSANALICALAAFTFGFLLRYDIHNLELQTADIVTGDRLHEPTSVEMALIGVDEDTLDILDVIGEDEITPGSELDEMSFGAWFDGWHEVPPPDPPDRHPEVARPRTWVLRKGWRRHRLIDPSEVPGGPAIGRAR